MGPPALSRANQSLCYADMHKVNVHISALKAFHLIMHTGTSKKEKSSKQNNMSRKRKALLTMSTTAITETHSMETEREEREGEQRRGFYKGQTVTLTRMLPSATMD